MKHIITNLIFIISDYNYSEKVEFFNSCLNIILNKNSYINFCGFEIYFAAYLSRWIKGSFDQRSIDEFKSVLIKNKSFDSLISFLCDNSDLESLTINTCPLKLLREKYQAVNSINSPLYTAAINYIDSKSL